MENRTRKNSLHLRLSDEMYIDLLKRSLWSGLTRTNIIELALKGQAVKSNPPREFYILLSKINNIGNNINQIAKIANKTGEIYYGDFKIYYKQIERFIDEVRKKYL